MRHYKHASNEACDNRHANVACHNARLVLGTPVPRTLVPGTLVPSTLLTGVHQYSSTLVPGTLATGALVLVL